MKNFLTIEELYNLFIECKQKITTDTRRLEIGAIFFALKGENFDANLFAQQAIEGGCKYVIVDSEQVCNSENIFLVNNVLEALQKLAKYHRQQLKIPIIGITGSNGKTTNKELIHAVLSKKYNTYATKGNLNNHIGVPLTLLALNHLHEMAIVEMGANHQGEIEFLCDIADPDYGIITNIGKAHLEGFGGIEGVKKGKSELYKFLEKKNAKIFINGNDEILLELASKLSKIYYGKNIEFDVHGELFQNAEFVEFKWNIKNETIENSTLVKTHMYGDYNFINLLCATCIGNYFEVNKLEINEALMSYYPEMNRSQVKKTEFNSIILDAYNANPSSMNIAINTFIVQDFKNKMAVLGDMLELGEYSEQEHEKILLQLNNSKIDNVYLVGNNFYKLKNQFSHYNFFVNVIELIDYFKNNKPIDTTILIKGSRGTQLEKIVDFL